MATPKKLKNKISQANLGMCHTPEVRLRISEAHKGVAKSAAHCLAIANGRKGIKFTDAHRASIAKSAIGRIREPESIQKSAEGNMKEVMVGSTIYKSIGEAAISNGITFKTVTRRIKSKEEKWACWKFTVSSK